jgi:2-(1,2-epoxy-1,2-dihydrophenyl)acetyl-CoA isomerase
VDFKNLVLSIQDGVSRITLNRPEKLNSLNEETVVELSQAVDVIERSHDVRVLLLTGAGRAFCAGQDLDDPAMHTVDGKLPDIGAIVERHFKPLVLRLQNLKVPSIAAVNGLAAGGGASLALACDIVVAAKSAYFLQAFSKIGLTPDTGSTWFLANKAGTARAIGLTYLAEKLPAEKAAEWGLIWQALDDADFVASTDKLAAHVATLPTRALVRTRELVYAARGHTLEQQLSMEATVIREMGWRQDYQEGVQAFLEKRAPQFTGQ